MKLKENLDKLSIEVIIKYINDKLIGVYSYDDLSDEDKHYFTREFFNRYVEDDPRDTGVVYEEITNNMISNESDITKIIKSGYYILPFVSISIYEDSVRVKSTDTSSGTVTKSYSTGNKMIPVKVAFSVYARMNVIVVEYDNQYQDYYYNYRSEAFKHLTEPGGKFSDSWKYYNLGELPEFLKDKESGIIGNLGLF